MLQQPERNSDGKQLLLQQDYVPYSPQSADCVSVQVSGNEPDHLRVPAGNDESDHVTSSVRLA